MIEKDEQVFQVDDHKHLSGVYSAKTVELTGLDFNADFQIKDEERHYNYYLQNIFDIESSCLTRDRIKTPLKRTSSEWNSGCG